MKTTFLLEGHWQDAELLSGSQDGGGELLGLGVPPGARRRHATFSSIRVAMTFDDVLERVQAGRDLLDIEATA